MAAGLGFKTFTTGEVLTSADTNGYLMQGVLVFASTAARDAAITAPEEGQFAFTKDTNSLWYYSGSAWVASGATGDIEGVTAGTGISGGGTSGTVTITNSMATEIDAKGDLVVGTGADTFARLAVGTNDYVLTSASGETTGLKWAAPAGGGAGNLTELASGSLSGSSLTFSSLSTYKNLILKLNDVAPSTAADCRVRINNNSGSNYDGAGFEQTGSTSQEIALDATQIPVNYHASLPSTGVDNKYFLNLTNCDTAGYTSFLTTGFYKNSTYRSIGVQGVYKISEAVSSLVVSLSTGTFSGGTYILMGA